MKTTESSSLPHAEADEDRSAQLYAWLTDLNGLTPSYSLDLKSLRLSNSDASFRRYWRVESVNTELRNTELRNTEVKNRYVIMDAPPTHEEIQPYLHVAELMKAAGLRVPTIYAHDLTQGFVLLSDLGAQTVLQYLKTQLPAAVFEPQATCPVTADIQRVYKQAVDVLVRWQAHTHTHSQAGQLPSYDATHLQQELDLFPKWYVQGYQGVYWEPSQQAQWAQLCAQLIAHNQAVSQVDVHRDFMMRNLMCPPQNDNDLPLGVLDFQDALRGPVTYDIASLMRDAFISFEEDFVIDMTARYWAQAKKAGIQVDPDFGKFYEAVEWMGLQRHLKVLGIFARLSLRDGKTAYLPDAPRFIRYVRHTAGRYQVLRPLLRLMDTCSSSL